MIRNGFQELHNTLTPAINQTHNATATVDEEHENLYEYLEDRLLSPTILSELNFPLIDSSTPHNTPLRKKLNEIEIPSIPSTMLEYEEEDEWETIETTVSYGNGFKQTFIEPEMSSTEEERTGNPICNKGWNWNVKLFLRLCCSKTSLEEDEMHGKLAILFENVDHISSRAFPLAFVFINIMYWVLYIYIL